MSETRGSARLALGLSFLQRHGVLLIRLAGLAVLARMLAPEQHGVFAAAIALSNMAMLVSELGVQQYLIRAPSLTLEAQRGALGLSLTMALGLSALVLAACLLAPDTWLSVEFRETLGLLALFLPMQPFNAVSGAVLQRQLRFAPIAVANLLGVTASALTSILLASQGIGAIALACGNVADTLVIFLVMRLAQPLLRPTISGWREMLRSGGPWTAVNLLWDLSQSLTHLITGAILGFGAVGLLARAQTVAWMFHRAVLDAVYPVVLPVIAARQRSGEPVGPIYIQQASYLAAVGWPFFGAMVILADPLVELMLGPQWSAAVPAVRVLALEGLFLPLAGLLMPYLTAFGLLGRFLRLQLALQAGKVLLIPLACLVSLEAVCWVVVAEVAVRVVLVQSLLRQTFDYRLRELAGVLLRCVPPTLACLIGPAAALAMVGGTWPSWLVLLAALGLGLPFWVAAILLLRHPLAKEFSRLLRLVRAARTASPIARAPLNAGSVQGPTA